MTVAVAIARALRPPERLKVSDWADRNRVLTSKSTAEPGKWRTSRTPYLKEIMDCLGFDHPCTEVVFKKGSQIGGTEVGNNWIGYLIDQEPCPIMAVQPTIDMAKRFSRQRIDPMLEETPVLHDVVSARKSRDSQNTMLYKDFIGGMLTIAGSNSATGLRSMPARVVFLDEIDAYPHDVGGEGSPIALAETRARTFSKRKIFKNSTPTVEGMSAIDEAWERSDQRRFEVPCPHCMHFQTIEWTSIRWDNQDPATARMVCVNCKEDIFNWQKTKMLAAGRWVPRNPESQIPGFQISSLYSPVGWYSWQDAVEQYLKLKETPEGMKAFRNTVLGETYAEKGDAPDWHRLYERREDYPIGKVPTGAGFLTCGVDVQADRLELEVVAWGPNKENWSVEYIVIPGRTDEDEVWRELDQVITKHYPMAEGEGVMPIRMTAIDSGFNTQIVYNYVRKWPPNRVIAVKGRDTSMQTIVGFPKPTDVRLNGRVFRHGVKVWAVGTDVAKSEIYARLRLDAPVDGQPVPMGFCHFPQYGDDFFRMLTAEQVVVRIVRGYRKREWQKIRDRNEALDCRVYNRAAAAVVGIDRFTEAHWERLTAMAIEPAKEKNSTISQTSSTKKTKVRRRKSNWL